MDNIEEKSCLCALNRIFGFKPKIGLALISHIGSASGVFNLSGQELELLLGPHSAFRHQIRPEAAEAAARELAEMEDNDISFIGWNEAGYPSLLRECEDAPIGLYVRSTTPMDELWAPRRRIAVVGTRDLTHYGREWCVRTVAGLSSAKEKPVIVSGLALGTDICAHRTALECGLPTIAVMATGPETVYPYRHRGFAERMYQTPGCALITDYPPGTAPLGIHFLRRNRIIAGLSDSTILIESRAKGGGMMTSRLAFSYSRDVFALPGRLDDPCSQGCNALIRSKIAEPIISVDGLLESLDLNRTSVHLRNPHEDIVWSTYKDSQTEGTLRMLKEVVGLIRKERGITLDEIAVRTGLEYRSVSQLTGLLEADGLIHIDILQRCTADIGKFQ